MGALRWASWCKSDPTSKVQNIAIIIATSLMWGLTTYIANPAWLYHGFIMALTPGWFHCHKSLKWFYSPNDHTRVNHHVNL